MADVAVVAGGERRAEAVVGLGGVADPRRVLRPQLAAGRGEAGDASRDQMDDAVVRVCAALARRPDREVEEAVAAEVADRQSVAEVVVVLGLSAIPAVACEKVWLPVPVGPLAAPGIVWMMPAFPAAPMSSPGTPTIRSPKALPPTLPMASEAPKPSPVSGDCRRCRRSSGSTACCRSH